MSQAPPPDSASLLVSSNVHKYSMKKKKVLSPEEAELYELSQSAGITLDQEVFKVLVDLLRMNVAPQAVFQTLKAMCAAHRLGGGAESGGAETSPSPHNNAAPSTSSAPTEVKGRVKVSSVCDRRSEVSGKLQRQSSATRGQKSKAGGASSTSS